MQKFSARLVEKRGKGGWDYKRDWANVFSDRLALMRGVCVLLGIFRFFLYIFLSLWQISQLGYTQFSFFCVFLLLLCEREERSGVRKGQREREMEAERDVQSEKEGEVERNKEKGIEESESTTDEACQEEDKFEEEVLDSRSTAKKPRLSAVFTDSQETAIVEFTKDHPEFYDKENKRFHDRLRKEAL